jgi:cobalt-precorrin 5A hydrolase
VNDSQLFNDKKKSGTAIISLSTLGAKLAFVLKKSFSDAEIYVHSSVDECEGDNSFNSVVDLTSEIFTKFSTLIYVMPTGVVCRAISGLSESKYTDPAVVVVDVMGRWAISLLSGHEGGANRIADHVSNIIGAEPIVTTTTEAEKNLIIGVGCRKGVDAETISDLIDSTVKRFGRDVDKIRYIATVKIKENEEGIVKAAESFGVPLRIISDNEILNCTFEFAESDFVKEKINLPAVAEPCALLAGRRTKLICPKTASMGVTVAIAEECSILSE